VPILGWFPREGEHTGNAIVAILVAPFQDHAQPLEWNAVNGVSWAAAYGEIQAAIDYAQAHNHHPRASRQVGQQNFAPD
jgi:hypothetical protein